MISLKSDDWRFVVEELEKHIENSRAVLENKNTSPDDTAFHRGKVALAKELLKLPESLKLRAHENI